jgi:hypothetical protein
MIAAGATPLVQLTIQLPSTGVDQDAVIGFNPLDFPPASITPTGNMCFVEAKLITDATNDTELDVDCWRLVLTTGSGAAAPGSPATIGSTTPTIALDGISAPTFSLDGIFQGGAPTGAPFENRNVAFTTTPPQIIGLDFAMGGDLPATAPACQTLALGADNTFISDTQTSAADGVKWYCFTLTGDATDENLKYIDMDTEGSAVDAAIAVFKADGTLVASDDNSGSGNNAMLSFGIGRRPSVGDGREYDGRNWDGTGAAPVHGLSAGTYFIAVAASGTGSGAMFAPAFGASANGTAGDINLRVRTNVTDGALTPSVAPVSTRITGSSGEDPLVSPGGQQTFVLIGPAVNWTDVQLCQAADANNTVSFDATGTDSPAYSMTVFDDSGNKVGGAAGTNTSAAVVNFGGAAAGLPAGHYFIAMCYDSPTPDLAPSPATAGRWHVRSESESAGFNFQLAVAVPWSACGPSVCCRNDFNGDGDVGTDADIESFFACISGNCCATCPPNADFNCDGDAGTDSDIEAFFRVLAGGSC